jgi:exodeoxyribonuclease-1|tara:strand:- start:2509 stop:3939 length:1431 start_codon:yes stop_codon:yes gene_type:complete
MHSDTNEKRTFYWIDYETWGVNPATDKPCQFAGIRTDEDLNIIGEPLVIYCQPPNDYLPSPEACLVTGITPQLAMSKGLSEPEFMNKIHTELSKPNTCTVGYNNVRFDDEVTRYGFYRNFIDPYEWSWKNGNSRWDLLDVLRACYSLRPDGINWAYDEDGLPSFKLEKLSIANGIEHASAHDAKSDVIALIELAKVVKKAQPKLFEYLFIHRDKRQLQKLIDVTNNKPLVHISGMFGTSRSNTSWIMPIIEHPKNSNAVVAIDLALDPTPLFDLNADDLRTRLYTKKSDLSEDELPAPIKTIHLNKCPILATAKVLSEADAKRINLDRTNCLENFRLLQESITLIKNKLSELYAKEIEYPKNDNIDAQLYNGFFTTTDKNAMCTIRSTSPENLHSIELSYDDERIPKLLFNYRARNFPHTLDEKELFRWNNYRREYFETHGFQFMESIESLAIKFESDEKKVRILKDLVKYAQDLT